MSDDLSTLRQTAQKGDPEAIAQWIQSQVKIPALTVTVRQGKAGYKVRMEGAVLPDCQRSAALLKGLFAEIDNPAAAQVEVYGWLEADDFPAWQTTLEISQKNTTATSDAAIAVPKVASVTAKAAPQPPTPPKEDESSSRLRDVLGAMGQAADAVGQAASQGGGKVANAIAGTAQTIGSAATRTGEAVVSTSAGALDALGKTAASVPQGLTDLVQAISGSTELRSLTKAFQVDWLIGVLDRVDVAKAAEQVRQLQAEYPDATPEQLAHKIMVRKALYVGGTGLASSLLPGFAAAMVAVDLAATTAIQAEMGYQIACAYGFDVHAEERKGEMLTIFALALGSNQALKTAFKYLARGIPIAGAAIGASTNAVALYAVGHAAAQYYEAKRNSPDSTVAIAELSPEDQADHWTAQQKVMDQILTHVIVAGYPDTDWEALSSQLTALNLGPTSVTVIQNEIEHPTELETLLPQLDDEFAAYLLAQCERLAELDGIVTDGEQTVLDLIVSQLSDRAGDETPPEAFSLVRRIRERFRR